MKASHVLKSMGVEESRALGAVTISLNGRTTAEETDLLLELLPGALAQQQKGKVAA